MDAAAGGVDEIRAGFHRGELRGAEHTECLAAARAVHGDVVRAVEQFVELDLGGAPHGDFVRGEIRVVSEHRHVEQRTAQLSDTAADMADADDADGLVADVVAGIGAAVEVRGALHGAFRQGDLLRER